MFAVREIVFQIKTKGIIEEYLPLDIDWEFNIDPVSQNWTFALHAYQFQLSDKVKGKLTMIVDSSLMNATVGWNLNVKE